MMSEHLAGMNEKLTQQKDEIDVLRSQTEKPKSISTSKVRTSTLTFPTYTKSAADNF